MVFHAGPQGLTAHDATSAIELNERNVECITANVNFVAGTSYKTWSALHSNDPTIDQTRLQPYPMANPSHNSSPYESYENTRLQVEFGEYASGPHGVSNERNSRGAKPSSTLLPKSASGPSLRARTDRIISSTRLVLRTLSFLLSASIVGILGHVVATRRATQNDVVHVPGSIVKLHIWIDDKGTRPTYVLLAISSVMTLLSLTLLIAIIFAKPVRANTSYSFVQ